MLGISDDIDEYKRIEKSFTTSAMQNGITSWMYDIGSRSIYSILTPLPIFEIKDHRLENVPEVFHHNPRLHPEDRLSLIRMHKCVCRGEPSASIVVRWSEHPENMAWSWFKLTYTTIFDASDQPVRAIGAALDISEQIKAEHLYNSQLAFRNSITQDALATLLLNLTKNTVSEAKGAFFEDVAKTTAEEMLDVVAHQVPLEKRAAIRETCSRKTFLKSFDNGQFTLTGEYLFGKSEQQTIWVKVVTQLIKNPDSGDIEAFLYLKNIDDQKLIEASYSCSALRDHDSLCCIHLGAATIKIIYDKNLAYLPNPHLQSPKYIFYVREMYGSNIIEEERSAYAESMALPTIIMQLDNNGQYTTSFRMLGEDGSIRQKRVHFSYINKERLLVSMVMSDVTDTFKAEQRKSALLRNALKAAKESSEAKTAFLANMSHEIRTPMNTIIGMSEILLNKNLTPEIANSIATIQSAGTGLLSIINDILDFSKVESGKFEINEAAYMPSSLCMDVNSMVAVRLSEKRLHFLINVNPEIPAHLKGDEVRVRQILTNVISNAIKYTHSGHVTLDVSGIYLPDGRFRLEMQVSDTGIGIREEDLPLLFMQFNRVDTKRNRHITGTGLGLALSRNLARLMGGDITVQSTYGVGSTFNITLIQDVEQTEPLAQVKVQGQKILIYEPDKVLADAISSTLQQLRVGWEICHDTTTLLEHKGITHVVLRRNFLSSLHKQLNTFCHDANIILLLENDETAEPRYMRHNQLQLPLFCLQIANVLNGTFNPAQQRRMGFDSAQLSPLPGVRVLIVDDNLTNLQVAKGLLARYHMDIDTALSGFEAIEKLRRCKYDLIFMDHMMPELDGVETTTRIRAMPDEYFQTVPIIALTANAILGAKEYFIKHGMTDFLAKPIELSKLNRLLKLYAVPIANARAASNTVEHREENALECAASGKPFAEISGIDTEMALSLYMDIKVFHAILKTYGSDIETRAPELRHFIEQGDLKAFTISIHAIKSASRSVGAFALGDAAEQLEVFSSAGDVTSVKQHIEGFMTELESMVKNVRHYITTWLQDETFTIEKAKHEAFDPLIVAQLKDACEEMDYDLAEKKLEELNRYSYPEKLQKTLDTMKACCADFDYTILDGFVNSLMRG